MAEAAGVQLEDCLPGFLRDYGERLSVSVTSWRHTETAFGHFASERAQTLEAAAKSKDDQDRVAALEAGHDEEEYEGRLRVDGIEKMRSPSVKLSSEDKWVMPTTIDQFWDRLKTLIDEKCGGLAAARVALTDDNRRAGAVRFSRSAGEILLEDEQLRRHYSAEWLGRQIAKFVSSVESEVELRGKVGSWISRLRTEIPATRLILPILGVTLDVDEVPIAGFVVRKGTETAIAQLRLDQSSIINCPERGEQERSASESLENRMLAELLLGTTFIDIPVRSDWRKALELGLSVATQVVDALRIVALEIKSSRKDLFHIRLPWQPSRTELRKLFVLSEDGFAHSSGRLAIEDPVTLNPDFVRAFDESGFSALTASVFRKRSTPFAEAIWRAAHWLSLAIVEDQKHIEISYLCICLESLFGLGQRVSDKPNKIAGLVQSLIAINHPELKGFDTLAVQLMKTRNEIVHEGRVRAEYPDLTRQRWLTHRCLWNAARLAKSSDAPQTCEGLRKHLARSSPPQPTT